MKKITFYHSLLNTFALITIRKSKKGIFIVFLVILCGNIMSQNAIVGSGFTNGWSGGCGTNTNFVYFSASAGTSYSSGDLTPKGTGLQYWRLATDWGVTKKEMNNTGSDQLVTAGTKYNLNTNCTSSGAMNVNVSSTNNRYVFKTLNATSTPTGTWVFFELTSSSVNVTTVAQSPLSANVTTSNSVTVTATLSSSFPTGQGAYLRYSTNNWTSSTIVAMTGSGTSYTAPIPSQPASTAVSYYVFTSGSGLTIATTDADLYTINLNNNSNSNYSYTVTATQNTPPTLTAANGVTVDATFDVTFTDDATWRGAITGITVGGVSLDPSAYNKTVAGKITFTPSTSIALQSSGTKTIVVSATGYSTASVSQTINAGVATKLAIVKQPTAPLVNGDVLTVQPWIILQDQYSNKVSNTASVTATVGAGTWTMGGTASQTATNDTIKFTGLSATSVASVTGATIIFTSGLLTNVTSGTFNIPIPTQIDWANVQWPQNGGTGISLGGEFFVYARVYKSGITDAIGQGVGIKAWVGYSSTDSDPSTWTESNWVSATYNGDFNGYNINANDEYKANIGAVIHAIGTYYYTSRFQIGSSSYVYGGFSAIGGGFWNGTTNVSGSLIISTTTDNLIPTNSSVIITSEQGTINAQFNGKAQIELFNSIGKLINSVKAENEFNQQVLNGIYLLRINGQTHKVLVQ